jgi:hypothetical protein
MSDIPAVEFAFKFPRFRDLKIVRRKQAKLYEAENEAYEADARSPTWHLPFELLIDFRGSLSPCDLTDIPGMVISTVWPYYLD